MNLDTWLLYLAAILLIAISPGTMAVLSMSHGIHFGKVRSLATAMGSVSSALLLMFASAAGLGALLSTTEYGFSLLKYCGAAYLIYLGIKLILTKDLGIINVSHAPIIHSQARTIISTIINRPAPVTLNKGHRETDHIICRKGNKK